MHLPARVVITDYGFPTVSTEKQIIEAAGGKLAAFQCKTEADVIAAAKDADALLVQLAPITGAVIRTLSSCKVIVRYGIGVDNIDLDAAYENGIMVCNVPEYCTDEVADHTFALAMCLTRQISLVDRLVRGKIWKIIPPRPMLASRRMTFVTIGYGRIARAVLDRARACKFNLATCDPYLSRDTKLPEDVQIVDMDEALRTGDIISLHVPLTAETHHLIKADSFCKMKTTSFLLNTARGGLVDTIALADALSNFQIAGAGLDVFEQEPLEEEHPLRKSSNVLLTSHIAWVSDMSVPELQKMAAQIVVRALSGETVKSRVA